MEVRFAIEAASPGEEFAHRLRDFNNSRSFEEIKNVLAVAIKGVDARLAQKEKEVTKTSLPSYDRTILLETSSETSANVSIGDLNGDGHLDIVLAKGRHWPLVDRVLLGDGNGGFPLSKKLGTASDRSYSGSLVDMDGDNDLDVIVSNDKPDSNLVYLNDGEGNVHVSSTYGDPTWSTRNASVADINGDGLPDVVVANRGPKYANYICLNRGDGKCDPKGIAFSRPPIIDSCETELSPTGERRLVLTEKRQSGDLSVLQSLDLA